jgi:hypothetical protein
MMTPQRARQIIADQFRRGAGSEIEITDAERAEIWAYVQAAPVNMSVRDMICRIGRDESPTEFPAWLTAARAPIKGTD